MADQDAVAIVPGKLYGLGGAARRDGRISWVPSGGHGYEPLNCYLLTEPDGALLIDTGVTAHADAIAGQLRGIAGPDLPVSVFLTRFEPDCVTNLAGVLRTCNVVAVYGGGVHNPFDFFDDLSPAEHVRHDHGVELLRKRPGERVPVSQTRSVEVLSTSLRVLTTFWAYDAATRTLFTSDAFGHAPLAAPGLPRIVDAGEDRTTPGEVADTLFTKFDWLLAADTGPLRTELAELLAAREVEIIAPTHGRILRGADVVRRHAGMLLDCLAGVAA